MRLIDRGQQFDAGARVALRKTTPQIGRRLNPSGSSFIGREYGLTAFFPG
jgi:hypothetical protein